MLQEREFTNRATSEYTARMCAKLGFARCAATTSTLAVGVAAAETVGKAMQADEDQQKRSRQHHQQERYQLDNTLAQATRALLRRGSICMHDFFVALRDGMCIQWATIPEQVLRGCSFEECATSLAPKEWAVFQRCYSARLRLRLQARSEMAPAHGGSSVAEDTVLESVRAECSRWLLPVDMGSGVVEEACRSIALEGDWGPFDALMSELAVQSNRHRDRGIVA